MAGHVNERAKFHRVLALLIVALFAFAGYVGWNLWSSAHQATVATHQADSAKDSAHKAKKNTQNLAEQIQQACRQGDVKVNGKDLCQKARKVAENPEASVPGPQGDRGDAGKSGPAPTAAQVSAAVKAYCADGKCQGQSGRDGKDGTSPSQADVAAAVKQYCAGGKCTGPSGKDSTVPGPAGKNGKDSTVAGPQGSQGPGPSDSQVASAVKAYCSDGSCRGPAGNNGKDGKDSTVPGPAGPKGDPGRSVTKVECPANGDWKVTYSDGTVDRISGPCRVSVPEPTTTP